MAQAWRGSGRSLGNETWCRDAQEISPWVENINKVQMNGSVGLARALSIRKEDGKRRTKAGGGIAVVTIRDFEYARKRI